MTKEKWEDVWNVEISYFFSIIVFIKQYNERQKELTEEALRKQRMRY